MEAMCIAFPYIYIHTLYVHPLYLRIICYAVTSKGFYHSVHNNNTRVSQVINPKIKRMKIVVGVLTLLMFFMYVNGTLSIIGA